MTSTIKWRGIDREMTAAFDEMGDMGVDRRRVVATMLRRAIAYGMLRTMSLSRQGVPIEAGRIEEGKADA